MKFLCVGCDAQMTSVDRAAPEDGTLAIVFACPECRREVAMLANPMETQMVKGLCVEVGGRSTPERPLEGVRAHLGPRRTEDGPPAVGPATPGESPARGNVGASGTVGDRGAGGRGGSAGAPGSGDEPEPGDPPRTGGGPGAGGTGPSWSPEAEARLGRVPGFVRGMVRQLYVDWAVEHGVAEITVQMMDRARADVGLEGV